MSPRPDKARLPLAAVVDMFLREKGESLSRYSIIHLRHSLAPLAAALDHPQANAVTYAELRAYVDTLYLRYKPGTIKPIVGDIRQFFRWAKKRGYVKRNPAKRLRPPSRRVLQSSAESKAAPEPDVRRVVDHLAASLSRVVYRDLFSNLCAAPASQWTYAEQLALRDMLLIVFLWETGARAGEGWRLSSRAMQEATSLPALGGVRRVVSTGKTAAVNLWFTQATAELWRIWYQIRPDDSEYAFVAWRCGHPPRPMTTETISKAIARRCRAAGVAPFRAHALRHAKAVRGAAAVGLAITSRLLGHSSVAVTATYAAGDDDELRHAAAVTGWGYKLWS